MQETFWFLCNFWESVVRQCFSSILVTKIGHTLLVSKNFRYQKIDHTLLLTKELVTYWKSLISRFCLIKYYLANKCIVIIWKKATYAKPALCHLKLCSKKLPALFKGNVQNFFQNYYHTKWSVQSLKLYSHVKWPVVVFS